MPHSAKTAKLPFQLHTFAERLRPCKILMLIDNTCALHMAIKGGNKCSGANELLHSMWLTMATHSMHIRFENVESKKNMADGPSRGSLDIVKSAGAEEVPGVSFGRLGTHQEKFE